MSESKLPPNVSKWWNLPKKQLTPEQLEIKRQYARDLYKKKKSTADVKELKAEIKFLKSIIENYQNNYQNYLNNTTLSINMTDPAVEIPATATFDNYKKHALAKPVELIGENTRLPNVQQAFIALAASSADLVKYNHSVHSCECGGIVNNSITRSTQDGLHVWSCELPFSCDIVYGFYALGTIKKVEIVYFTAGGNKPVANYGEIRGNYCKFPIPLPKPQLLGPTVRVTFTDDLILDRWQNLPSPALIFECGIFSQAIRQELGLNLTTNSNTKWPEEVPRDNYFLQALVDQPMEKIAIIGNPKCGKTMLAQKLKTDRNEIHEDIYLPLTPDKFDKIYLMGRNYTYTVYTKK